MAETFDPTVGPGQSPQLLQLLFDHSGEGLAVFDAQWCLLACNLRYLELSELPPEQVRPGMALRELLLIKARAGDYGPGDPQALAQQRLDWVRQHPTALRESRMRDGRAIEIRRNSTPEGGFVVLVSDITERKKAQASLADQQRMLELLIQHTEQGIWFIDNDLRTTDANPAMCRMLGRPLADLLGRTIFDFVDKANAAIFREHIARRAQGHADSYEIALLRADGQPVHCYNSATPIFDAAGRKVGAVGMFSDISPLKRAQDQVRLTSELLAQKSRVLEVTLDSLSQGVLSADAQGRTSAYNRRFLELSSIPEPLMQTRPTLQGIRAYQMAQGHIPYDAPGEGAEAWHRRPSRYQRRTIDGLVIEVQTHTASDGSLVRTYTDVTAAVQAQQALQDSESRFRSMADAAPAFIWQSCAEGAPVWFNQRWLQCTGRSMQSELALPWPARMHADDLDRSRELFLRSAAARQPYELEFRVRCADGSLLWLVDHGIPHFAPDGSFDGFVVYGWDITERKATQAALMRAKEDAERANRAKSEFLSRMSHELRTPLNAVLGFAQLMDADLADPLSAVQHARVQELQRGGRHLLRLINDVLDLARIEAGTLHLSLTTLALEPVLRDCLQLVQPTADAHGLQVEVQPGPWLSVRADATRLKQVLLNLLSNAIKYNRPGGRVQLACRADGDEVRVEVRDTGPGLTAAQQERLFHAFERLDAAHGHVEGAGIGLALSKWLLDLMQGRIGVDSAPGQGSVFWFTLARADAAAADVGGGTERAAPAQPRPMPPAVAARPRQVLYIEDNEVNRLLMEGMLAQRPQLRLCMAALPQEGLAMALQDRPDLLLLDIQLPGIDGFEVLRRLRAHEAAQGLPPLPVVAVSANAMPADRDKAAQASFADYITKPIELLLLLATLDRWLGS